MKSHLRKLAFGLLLAAVFAAPARLPANEQVYQTILPGTAYVAAGPNAGTGVLVDASKRWLVTNYHVVRDAAEVKVFFPASEKGAIMTEPSYYARNADRIAVRGKVLGRNVAADLAVIELERLPESAREVKLASVSARPGQVLHAIGNPGAEPAMWLYATGKTRSVFRKKMMTGQDATNFKFLIDSRLLVSSIPVNPGDSGGPVVNDSGELVGITQGWSKIGQQFSYAIDVEEVRGFLAKVQSGGMNTFFKIQDALSNGPIQEVKHEAPPQISLRGTWKAMKTYPNGNRVRFELTAKEADLFLQIEGIETGTKTGMVGTYRFEGNRLMLTSNGRTQVLGTVTWINAGEFTFQDELITLTFRKSN
jgi:S1-C subfamily serine protease